MEGILVSVIKGLFILVAAIMTFFILLQEGKGGGLAGLGGTKAAGVEGVTNPIRRATAVLSIIFFSMAILLGILARPEADSKREGLYDAQAPAEKKKEPAGASAGDKKPAPVEKKAEDAKKPDAGDKKAEDTKKDADAKKGEDADAKKDSGKADGKKAEVSAEKPAEKAETPAEKPGEPAKKKVEAAAKEAEKATEKAADQPAEKKAE